MATVNETPKAKAPSTIKLITFAIYKSSADAVEILHGAAWGSRNSDGHIELEAGSVPFHADSFKDKAPKPGFGLLMLYGVRDSLEEIQHWRAKARELNAEFAYAEFEFDVGQIEVGFTDRAMLKTSAGKNRFLNFRRMKSSLQSEILHKFVSAAESAGEKIDENLNRVSQIATRPDLFDELFFRDRALAKLDVLIIPVADDPGVPGKVRHLAYVRPGARVVSVVQGGDPQIALPAWMKDKKVARNVRRQAALKARALKIHVDMETRIKEVTGGQNSVPDPESSSGRSRRRIGPV